MRCRQNGTVTLASGIGPTLTVPICAIVAPLKLAGSLVFSPTKPRVKKSMDGDVPDVAQAVLEERRAISEIPPILAPPLLHYLQGRKDDAFTAGQFCDVQRIHDKINALKLAYARGTFSGMLQDRCLELRARLDAARGELARQRDARSQRIDAFDGERARDLAHFEEEAGNALSEFDAMHDCAPPAPFRKWSHAYLNLRKKEEYLVSSKRYVEAEKLKQEADQRETVERENQQSAWTTYVNKQRFLLMTKQAAERRALDQKWSRHRQRLVSGADAEVSQLESLIRNLQSKIAEIEGDQTVTLEGASTRPASRMLTARVTTPDAQSQRKKVEIWPHHHHPNRLRSRIAWVRSKAYVRLSQTQSEGASDVGRHAA
jgi:hypothetical protein